MINRGIIFDLDGTLWETIDVTYESANEIAKKYGLEKISKDTICNAFGTNKLESFKMYFPSLNLFYLDKIMYEIGNLKIEKLNKGRGNIYFGVKETLIELSSHYQLFIVSNTAEEEYINAFLTSSGLKSYFKDSIAASKLNLTKEDAIKQIIENNNLNKAVYVGDTKKDLNASYLSNIPFVYAKYGFGNNLKTKYVIEKISDLPDVIEKIIV